VAKKPAAGPAPKQAAPKRVAPKPVASKQAAPKKTAPKKAAPPAPPKEAEAPEVVEPKVRNSRIAAAVVLFVVAGLEFATAYITSNLVVAGLLVILGVSAVVLGVYLFRGKFVAWGTSMFVNALGILLALIQLGTTLGPVLLVVIAASYVVLYIVRLSFGVGVWEIEATKQNVEARALIGARTTNPAMIRCPKCGNERLWVGEDGSAFCFACQAGTIELVRREPS